MILPALGCRQRGGREVLVTRMMQRNGEEASGVRLGRGVGCRGPAATAVLPPSTNGGWRRADVWRPCTQYGRTSCVWIFGGGDSVDADPAPGVSAVPGSLLCGVRYGELQGGGGGADVGGPGRVCATRDSGGAAGGTTGWVGGGLAGGGVSVYGELF